MSEIRELIPRGFRVLVVEDEPPLARAICALLRDLHIDPLDPVATGEDALRVAEEEQPDLVLMDVRLQGPMDGVEAARRVGALDIPVVFLTASSDLVTMERAVDASSFGYLLKPFDRADLVAVIATASRRAATARATRDLGSMHAAMLDGVVDAVVGTDPSQSVVYMNPAAETLLGVSLDEARGQVVSHVVKLAGEGGAQRLSKLVVRVLTERCALRERRALRGDGGDAPLPVSLRVTPVVARRGRLLGAMVSIEDLRELRVAEASLWAAREAGERARRLEEIGRVAGGVAHDFNNLVMTLSVGCAQLEADARLDERGRRVLGDMQAAAERAAALTRELLAHGQQQVFVPRRVDVNAVLSGFSHVVRRAVGARIEVVFRADATRPEAIADPLQIERLVMNLALNAHDAMPTGGTLTVSTRDLVDGVPRSFRGAAPPGTYVQIIVEDTGAGVDPTIRPRLFEPFASTKGSGVGRGLGLSTAAYIAEQSGGFIDYDSQPGQGARFVASLPRAPALDETVTESAGAVPAAERRLLIVEDVAPLREVLASVLRNAGYDVLEADSGEAAMALIREEPGALDLLLADVVMQGIGSVRAMDDFERRWPRAPIVAMSGFADHPTLRHRIETGRCAFLQKPFTPQDLLRAVRVALAKRAAFEERPLTH